MGKAMDFVRQGLVSQLGDGRFVVRHLPHTARDHIVDGENCTCQNTSKCSHIFAVQIYVNNKNKSMSI